MKQAVLKGKFLIEAVITLVTGLHIGTSSDFTPIGAVESPFVRDHFTKVPIIPGSSLKGKLRTLLAKMRSPGYVLNKIEDDDEIICRYRLHLAQEQLRQRQYRARLKGCRQVPILRLNLCTTSKTKKKSKKISQPYRQRL